MTATTYIIEYKDVRYRISEGRIVDYEYVSPIDGGRVWLPKYGGRVLHVPSPERWVFHLNGDNKDANVPIVLEASEFRYCNRRRQLFERDRDTVKLVGGGEVSLAKETTPNDTLRHMILYQTLAQTSPPDGRWYVLTSRP